MARRWRIARNWLGLAEAWSVSGHEECAERRIQFLQWSGDWSCVDGCAVVEVAGHEHDVGLKTLDSGHDASEEVSAVDVAEVNVGNEGGDAPTPCVGKVGESNPDPAGADPARIQNAVECCD